LRDCLPRLPPVPRRRAPSRRRYRFSYPPAHTLTLSSWPRSARALTRWLSSLSDVFSTFDSCTADPRIVLARRSPGCAGKPSLSRTRIGPER
jgi:hypothetical protein